MYSNGDIGGAICALHIKLTDAFQYFQRPIEQWYTDTDGQRKSKYLYNKRE